MRNIRIARSRKTALAPIFELRRLQHVGSTASSRLTAKDKIQSRGHFTRTTLWRHTCRRSQIDATVDRGKANAPRTPFAGFGSPPLFGFTLSPSMSGPPIMSEVRSLSTRPGRQGRSPSDRVSPKDRNGRRTFFD